MLGGAPGRCGQVLGPGAPASHSREPGLPARRPPSWGRTRRDHPHPRRARRDLRPRFAPDLPAPQLSAPPDVRPYLSPACRQYATMMSREGARRAGSRGPVKGGSACRPAAGRSGLRSGRGGAPGLPIPPPLAPPRLPERPLPSHRRILQAPRANGGARPGPRVPIPGRAGRSAARSYWLRGLS